MTGLGKAGHVYRAINSITTALSVLGIPKAHTNPQDQYNYRSIDDVLARLAPLFAKHRLCVLPRVVRRECVERTGEGGSVLLSVHVLVAYDLVSARDGSRHTLRASGEAVDGSDKATAKALSAAYKSAMLQAFCIPVGGSEEADASTQRLRKSPALEREPVQGWQAWSEDIIEIIGGCEAQDALDRMRSRQAALLTAISRERVDLYAKIGEAFSVRSKALARPAPLSRPNDEVQSVEAAQGTQADPVNV